ncbi:hypothetical protein TWF506_007730 [Arthrobotrys conoides]|uniref:Uncharacterized protein n=1 Tax=Arthrobotrys conoides TaxID=74498 RepID=A0AAN8PIK1_9PEZI
MVKARTILIIIAGAIGCGGVVAICAVFGGQTGKKDVIPDAPPLKSIMIPGWAVVGVDPQNKRLTGEGTPQGGPKFEESIIVKDGVTRTSTGTRIVTSTNTARAAAKKGSTSSSYRHSYTPTTLKKVIRPSKTMEDDAASETPDVSEDEDIESESVKPASESVAATTEVPEEEPQETIKEVPEEEPQETTKEEPGEEPQKTNKEPEEGPQETSQELPEEEPQEAPKETPREPEEKSNVPPEEISEVAPQEVPQKTNQEASQRKQGASYLLGGDSELLAMPEVDPQTQQAVDIQPETKPPWEGLEPIGIIEKPTKVPGSYVTKAPEPSTKSASFDKTTLKTITEEEARKLNKELEELINDITF